MTEMTGCLAPAGLLHAPLRPLRPVRLLRPSSPPRHTRGGRSADRLRSRLTASCFIGWGGLAGPVDSTARDPDGAGSTSASAPDTRAFYLLERPARRHRVLLEPGRTTPTGPTPRFADRSTTPPAPRQSHSSAPPRGPPAGRRGTRSVLDLLVLRNDSRFTRVAPRFHPAQPGAVRCLRAPTGSSVEKATSLPDAIARRDDSVIVLAPFAPGEKQLDGPV